MRPPPAMPAATLEKLKQAEGEVLYVTHSGRYFRHKFNTLNSKKIDNSIATMEAFRV
jgi:hypothetical protein